MTKLAVSIWVNNPQQALADTARAAEAGADLVELRLDNLADAPEAATTIVQQADLPCIATCRPVWEGGHFEGEEPTRLTLFEALSAGPRQPAYLDIELAAWQHSAEVRERMAALVSDPKAAAANAPGLILSSHDFEGRPADLLRRVEAMAGEPLCRVIKLAWRARSLRDNLEAFELLSHQLKPMICLCMGEFGVPSRVLAPKFGALLSFASLDEEQTTAAGQVTAAETTGLYRWRALQKATRVFGVIGYPVGHSMSPPIHNAGFEAIDYDGVYLPLPIHAEYEQFKATVGMWLDAESLNFQGASVTIPHKQNLLRYVKEQGGRIEPLAETIGAANTLSRLEDGTLYASNTDYAAALDATCAAMNIDRAQLSGRRIAVLGAGGAARAIVAGFAHHGSHVTIYNRTLDKAQAIAESFDDAEGRVTAAPLDALAGASADVIINCTPIGMHPDTDASPVGDDVSYHPAWGDGTLVFDTIYNPPTTRLLEQADAAGCQTIGGVEMFIRQAAVQFELWTHQPAPLDTFREVMQRRLP
jgi:3-dehydroquinate dehydratase/shikimate dehydrogenase